MAYAGSTQEPDHEQSVPVDEQNRSSPEESKPAVKVPSEDYPPRADVGPPVGSFIAGLKKKPQSNKLFPYLVIS